MTVRLPQFRRLPRDWFLWLFVLFLLPTALVLTKQSWEKRRAEEGRRLAAKRRAEMEAQVSEAKARKRKWSDAELRLLKILHKEYIRSIEEYVREGTRRVRAGEEKVEDNPEGWSKAWDKRHAEVVRRFEIEESLRKASLP